MAELKSPRWALTRRRVSASTTPIEALGKVWLRSTESGSTPISPAKRSQMVRFGASGDGSGSTCTRSAGNAGDHRSSTRRTSRVRQFQTPVLSVASLPAVLGHRPGVPVLDALLPARGEQAQWLAGRHDQVHLGRGELIDHPRGLLRRCSRVELMADQRGPRPLRDVRAKAVPGGATVLAELLERGVLPDHPARPEVLVARLPRQPHPLRLAAPRGCPTGSSGGTSWPSWEARRASRPVPTSPYLSAQLRRSGCTSRPQRRSSPGPGRPSAAAAARRGR